MSAVQALRRVIRGLKVAQLVALLEAAELPCYGRLPLLKSRLCTALLTHESVIADKMKEMNLIPPPRPKRQRGPRKSSMGQKRSNQYSLVSTVSSGVEFIENIGRSAANLQPSFGVNVSQVPRHPDVNLVKLPFKDVVAELMKPTALTALVSTHVFTLTPLQAQKIKAGYCSFSGQYEIQVLIRLSLVEVTSAQYDFYPRGLVVYVNGKYVTLPEIVSKKYQPINVTEDIIKSPLVDNTVLIKTSGGCSNYAVTISLAKQLSADTLLTRLPTRIRQFTTAQLLENERRFKTASKTFSLICPLGQSKIKYPCRALICEHLDVFDAEMYLRLNAVAPKWQCPICGSHAEYNSLIIDEFFEQVLASCADHVVEVRVMANGTWTPTGGENGKKKLKVE